MSNMPANKARLTLYIEKRVKERVSKYAAAQDRSTSKMTEIILKTYLDDQENKRTLV